MKINKEICKHCHAHIRQWEWGKSDEFYWNEGMVLCPRFNDVIHLDDIFMLNKCFYKLEHIVINEKP